MTKIDLTPSVLTGKVVEWDRHKGFGFIQNGNACVFLHRRDFAGRTPAVGDNVRFTMGWDPKGRACAKTAACTDSAIGRVMVTILVWVGLPVLPVVAATRQGVDVRWVAAYAILLSAVTYWAYAHDKRRAQEGGWRVPEAHLHLLELLGGWPGAFAAQRLLRHKCSKVGYQASFWLIVLLYQFAAFDSLQNWRISQAALSRIEATMERRR